MIDIQNNYSNKANVNTIIDNSTTIPTKNSSVDNLITTTESLDKSETDTITISNGSKNLTNAQKVKKAFDDTYSEFKNANLGNMDASCWIAYVSGLMKINDIHPVPKDILSSDNSKNNYSFLDFVDKMKEFAKTNSNKFQIPDKFLDICDKLKQNMILNGVQ